MADDAKTMKSLPSEQKLFVEALQITSPEARAAYLEDACQGDGALRGRVMDLLHAAEAAGDFLEVPPTGLQSCEASDSPPGEQPGDRIGRYKLLELIGEGGFGMVYMAEQEEPVQRRVALKIIKPGMDSKQVIARFEAERQALALMDHPNIAKVLDGGSTESGRPFFVMELVRGIPITDYCDQNVLSTQERLDLFVLVCQAVQHAHQKGVIHRDIKPSNILVTVNDGLATPKVIDFGIAKAIGQKLTDKTLFTQFHAFMGTPAYTSPEQAEMSSVDVDTRSDIYSLGVLLYELLTGKPPFDSTELLSAGLDEMRRIIRQVEPLRPSMRLSTLGISEATELSRKRQIKVPELANVLRGELDWVVMKCLEKDRARRYETAIGLAADIQRHLRNEPVVARPPSAIYLFGKLVRRHKLASVAGAAVALSLLAGIAGTSGMYLKARAAERRAGSEAALALAVNEFLQEDILKQSTTRMNYRWRRSLPAPNLLQGLARAENKVANRFQKQPVVEAAVRYALGAAYANLGRPSNAIPQLQRALELRKRELGMEHPDTLDAVKELALAYAYSHDFTNSIELLKVCLPAVQNVFGPNHPKALEAQAILAETRWRLDRSPANRADLEAAFRALERVASRDETSYMECAFWLATAYEQEGRKDESIQLQTELLARIKLASDPLSPVVVAETGWLADSYESAGRFSEAVEQYRLTAALCKRVYGEDDIVTIDTLGNLAQNLVRCGRPAEALGVFQSILERKGKTLPPGNQEVLKFRQKLGWCYLQLNQQTNAIRILEDVLHLQSETLGTNSQDTCWTMGDLAAAYHETGRLREARELYESDLRFMQSELGAGNGYIQWLEGRLVAAYLALNQPADALALCQTNLMLLLSASSSNAPAALRARYWSGQCYAKMGRLEQATRIYEDVVHQQIITLKPDDPDTYFTMGDLAFIYMDTGRFQDAIPWLEKSFEFQKRRLGSENGYTRFLAERLATAREKAQQPAQAAELRKPL